MKRRTDPLLKRLCLESLEPRMALSANGLPNASSLELPGFPDVTIAAAEAAEEGIVQQPLPVAMVTLPGQPASAGAPMASQTPVQMALNPAALLMIADDWPD